MVQPISPENVKEALLPDEVIEVFNELIQEHWNGHNARILQSKAADIISKRMKLSQYDIYERRYLDIEQVYRDAGWKVKYDKPGYNETYEATFTFSRNA